MQQGLPFARPQREEFAPDAWLLPAFAATSASALVAAAQAVAAAAPFRSMTTPSGKRMSVTTTSCGRLGWCASASGYAYREHDPLSGDRWPAMPAALHELAHAAAAACGWPDFAPDSCLVNRYAPGAKMGLHQDRDERDLARPIVSVSLGLPATFLFGGAARSDRVQRVPLQHGDVVVFGGRARLRYHGVAPVVPGHHPLLDAYRLNLTLRVAG